MWWCYFLLLWFSFFFFNFYFFVGAEKISAALYLVHSWHIKSLGWG